MPKNTQYPLISVILPGYNAGPCIRQAMESVLTQTCEIIEVLVVGDGSEDDTAAIARAVGSQDPRVRLLQRPSAGVAAARDHALNALDRPLENLVQDHDRGSGGPSFSTNLMEEERKPLRCGRSLKVEE